MDRKLVEEVPVSMFVAHLETFLDLLAGDRRFALTRYGDGERAILQGCEISTLGTNRHWCHRPSLGIGSPALTADLGRALDLDHPAYHVGISCPCCNLGDHRYYTARLPAARRRGRTTYANLFSNGNWPRLAERFTAALTARGRPVVLVTNWDKGFERAARALPGCEVHAAPASAPEYDRPIPNPRGEGFYHGGATLWYAERRDAILARHRELARSFHDAVFLVQLGPIANVLVCQMFEENPNNTYLDMGHALDGILYGEPCRGFMIGEPSPRCADMDVVWNP